LINFNNGVPDIETQRQIEKDVTAKWAGGKAKSKIVIAFNDDKDSQATIEDIQLGDAHDRYQFLSNESEEKLMMAHKVVYPLFTYDRTGTGLGNNAEELKNAYELMMEMVIRPKQDFLIKAFDELLNANDIALRLYFEPLKPVTWQEDVIVTDQETAQEQGVAMSSHSHDISDEQFDEIFAKLEEFGEDEDLENWELVSSEPVDYDTEDLKDQLILSANKRKESIWGRFMTFLASTGVARSNARSEQDGDAGEYNYRVRYQYAPLKVSDNSREFCRKMVGAKKIYRKEDIIRMGETPVNAGFGVNGASTYNIWLYKGSVHCKHYWMRKTYRSLKPSNPDTKNPNSEVSVNQSRKDGFTPETNDKKVATRPADMPNGGAYPK